MGSGSGEFANMSAYLGGVSYSALLISVILLSLMIIVIRHLHATFSRNPRLVKFAATLPGPPTVPVIGNGLDFFFAGANISHKIMEYSEKYGSTFRLWFGKHLIVCLSDVEDLEMLFRNSKMMSKPALFEPIKDFFGDGLFSSPMHIWKKTRKLHQPAFVNSVLPSYVPDFNNKIYKSIEIMKKLVDGPEFDVGDYLSAISFEIITKTALGIEMERHDTNVLQFHKCLQTVFEADALRIFRPWLHSYVCNLIFGKRVTQVRNKMFQFVEHVISNKLNRGIYQENQQDENNDIDTTSVPSTKGTTPFLSAAYQSQFITGSKTILRDEIITILSAGTETTGTTVAFCIMAIAANPDIQEKLYDEIYEVYGAGEQPADADDVCRLPYLDQVVKETLRRFPVGPTMFKNVDEDAKIGSRIFPAGTGLLISIFGIHMNPKYYPNPEKFNPENFSTDAVAQRPKLAYLPFGAGARNCIGQNYAMLEMKLTLIALLRTFSFATHLKLEDLKLVIGLSLGSVDGYNISIKLRDRRPSYLRSTF